MTQPTKLGKILLTLFPKTMNRLIELSELRDEAIKIQIKQRAFGLGQTDKSKYHTLSKYYKIAEEFNNKKFFWMKDIKWIKI